MNRTFHYQCSDCGREYPSDSIIYLCPSCSKEQACSGKQETGTFPRGVLKTFINPEYLKNLSSWDPIEPVQFSPLPIPDSGTYPVGDTPLVEPGPARRRTGFPGLYLKNDGVNPSGSLKDRASQLVAAQALHYGETVVTAASTGNAGSAMACAGAAYGLSVILFVPAGAPRAKLVQSVLYGAAVIPVNGTYDDAFALSIEFTEKFGGINRNTAFNPLTIEGKKSVSIEIFNQLGQKAPDTVYVPTGDGVILAGVYKGFADLYEAELIESVPRIVCVQAEKSNAISRAFKTGKMNNLSHAETRADSISVASPANGRMAVEYIRASGGRTVEVTDNEISDAQLELGRYAGTFAEPAAAAAYAGFMKDLDTLDKESVAVVLLTGSGFKDVPSVEERLTVPQGVDPDLGKIEKYIASHYPQLTRS